MTPMQKQAVLVCVICVLAALLTAGITTALLKRGKTPAANEPAVSEPQSVDPTKTDGDLAGHYQINNASSALLTETADAGSEYQDSTLFLGDSNTVRLYNNGLISLQQFCAREGIGTQVALNEGIVTFKGDNNHYTIAQAVAKMKPRRVVMTFGTNDTGMEVQDFISNCAGAGHSGGLSLYGHHCQHRAAHPGESFFLPPHGSGQDRRLQHGTAEHVRAAGPQVPQHG